MTFSPKEKAAILRPMRMAEEEAFQAVRVKTSPLFDPVFAALVEVRDMTGLEYKPEAAPIMKAIMTIDHPRVFDGRDVEWLAEFTAARLKVREEVAKVYPLLRAMHDAEQDTFYLDEFKRMLFWLGEIDLLCDPEHDEIRRKWAANTTKTGKVERAGQILRGLRRWNQNWDTRIIGWRL